MEPKLGNECKVKVQLADKKNFITATIIDFIGHVIKTATLLHDLLSSLKLVFTPLMFRSDFTDKFISSTQYISLGIQMRRLQVITSL